MAAQRAGLTQALGAMNKFIVVSSLLIAQLLCGRASAESCDGIYPPTDRWVRGMTEYSDFIFFGTIVSIKDGAAGVQELQFNIIKELKGKFEGPTLSGDWGPGYPLTIDEPRVFFVSGDKHLQSCSEYKYYFTDRAMQAEIRAILKGT